MRLIGKPAGERRLGQRGPGPDQVLGSGDAELEEVSMWRQPRRSRDRPDDSETAGATGFRQILEGQGFIPTVMERFEGTASNMSIADDAASAACAFGVSGDQRSERLESGLRHLAFFRLLIE